MVDQAKELATIFRLVDREVLVAASYLHVGYAPELARTGFHPLDGARYLRALGHERLACLGKAAEILGSLAPSRSKSDTK